MVNDFDGDAVFFAEFERQGAGAGEEFKFIIST
jgi:hypothetical protein